VTVTLAAISERRPPPRITAEQTANRLLAAEPARAAAPPVRWRLSGDDADVLAVGANGEVFRRTRRGFEVDLADRRAAWSYRGEPATGGFSDGVVGSDGTLFTVYQGRLYAIDAGTKRWEFELPADVVRPRVVATDDNGAAYLAVQYARSSGVIVVDADGRVQSTTPLTETIVTDVAPAADGAIITAGQRVLKIERDGAVVWEHTFDAPVSRPAAVDDGRLYVGAANTLWVVSDDGSPPDAFFRSAPDERGGGTPLVRADGLVYWMPGRLYAIGADGSQQWRWGERGYADSGPAMLADGTVVFTTRDRQIVAIDSAGRKLWSFAETPPPLSSPARLFAGPGFLYVHYPHDRFLAFDIPPLDVN
jgi:outer membrane protein assembly factor BamB